MKKHPVICLCLLLCGFSPLFAQAVQEQSASGTVTVYATDSFCGDWGPGPTIVPAFEEKTGIKVKLVSAGSSGEMLTKLESEKKTPIADVVVGFPDSMAIKAYQADIFTPYESPVLKDIPSFLQFDPQHRLLPFDYGDFAFVYDSEKISEEMLPHCLQDLTDPKYKGKVILIDPRTSSVGLGLMLWTIEVFGEDGYLNWWRAMRKNALTITDGWSSAYGLFTEGEAPLVISYTTSPVYHVTYEDSTRYRTLLFTDGHETTIEGIGLTKKASHNDAAKAFIDFLLTDAQMDIANANSMYPANTSIVLPAAFDYAPKPEKDLTTDPSAIEKNLERWLTDWERAMSD